MFTSFTAPNVATYPSYLKPSWGVGLKGPGSPRQRCFRDRLALKGRAANPRDQLEIKETPRPPNPSVLLVQRTLVRQLRTD